MKQFEAWAGFKGRLWKEEVNTRDFIQNNYTCYDGDESFLAEPTQATNTLWGMLKELQKEERAKGGVLDMETEIVSGLTAYGAAYIGEGTKDLEKVVGLQTDKPLKRAFMPYGGIKMAEQACTTYGYQPSEKLHEIFHSIAKLIMMAYSMLILQRSRAARKHKFLLVCRIPTAVAVSWATIVVSLCTELTSLLLRSRRIWLTAAMVL